VPHASVLRVGLVMPKGWKRYFGRGDLHFLTFSCYQRLPLLGTVRARKSLSPGSWKDSRAIRIPAGRIRGDAQSCAPADQRIAQGHALGRAEGLEAARVAGSAPYAWVQDWPAPSVKHVDWPPNLGACSVLERANVTEGRQGTKIGHRVRGNLAETRCATARRVAKAAANAGLTAPCML
jgi:hypothetical protein